MRVFGYILSTILFSTPLFSQSFYLLTGVTNYDTVVANMSKKTAQYTHQIKALMQHTSKEIGVDTTGHPSRVLVFVITDISLGDTVGFKVDLQLGEYIKREGYAQKVFGITYQDTKHIAPDFSDMDDVEEQLSDSIEEMLERFKLQYEEDNPKQTQQTKPISHENFAEDMHYETNYQTALAKAQKENKSLLLFMTTSYCPWCRKLENRLLSQPKINAKIHQRYIPVTLNLDKDNYPKPFGKTRFTPIIYIVNAKSQTIEHQFIGYSAKDEFIHLLK